jgi:hypothetical protein
MPGNATQKPSRARSRRRRCIRAPRARRRAPARVEHRGGAARRGLQVAVATMVLTAIAVAIAFIGLIRPPDDLRPSEKSFWIVVSPRFAINLLSGAVSMSDGPASDPPSPPAPDGSGTKPPIGAGTAAIAARHGLRRLARRHAGARIHCEAAPAPPHGLAAIACRLGGYRLTYARFATSRLTREWFARLAAGARPVSAGICVGVSTWWTTPAGVRAGRFAIRGRGPTSSVTWTYGRSRTVARVSGPGPSEVCGRWSQAAL